MATLEWILSEWHAFSSSNAPIKMDGVLYQDLYTIIRLILDHPVTRPWMASLKALYDHTSDYNNPHNVTLDQLPTEMIDLLYDKWIEEGYKGTKDHFIYIIFLYLRAVDYEEMITHNHVDNDKIIPSVRAVSLFLRDHDRRKTAHTDLLRGLILGTSIPIRPEVVYYQDIGTTVDGVILKELTDTQHGAYHIYASALGRTHLPRVFSLTVTARIDRIEGWVIALGKSADCIGIKYSDSTHSLAIVSTKNIDDPTKWSELARLNVQSMLLQDHDTYLTSALVYRDGRLTLMCTGTERANVSKSILNEYTNRQIFTVPSRRIRRSYLPDTDEAVLQISIDHPLKYQDPDLYFRPLTSAIKHLAIFRMAFQPSHVLYLGGYSKLLNSGV